MEKKTKGTLGFVLNQPSPLLFYLTEKYLDNLLFPLFFATQEVNPLPFALALSFSPWIQTKKPNLPTLPLFLFFENEIKKTLSFLSLTVSPNQKKKKKPLLPVVHGFYS